MALSGKTERRSLSLVDVQWAEIDAEAETDGCKWYEVIQHYIQQGRKTEESRLGVVEVTCQRIEAKLETMITQVSTLASIIEHRPQGVQPAVEPASAVEPAPTSEAPEPQTPEKPIWERYHDAAGGPPPDPFAPKPAPAPAPASPLLRWWRAWRLRTIMIVGAQVLFLLAALWIAFSIVVGVSRGW